MIAYVVVRGFSYEGIQSLVKAFTSELEAKQYCNVLKLAADFDVGDWYEVIPVLLHQG